MNLSTNIVRRFRHNCSAYPEKLFVKITKEGTRRSYSYRDILEMTQRYNGMFRSSGAEKGTVVAIVLDHSPDVYGAFLGAMMAGFVPALFPYPTPKQDHDRFWRSHRELFELTRIRHLLGYRSLGDLEQHFPNISHVWHREDQENHARDERIDDFDIALLQHSSGTTGLKKGVALTHNAVTYQAETYAGILGLTKNDKIATWLPLYHDMGLIACFLMPIIVGCSISHLDAFEWTARPTSLLDEIEAFGARYVWLPNFAFNHIINGIRGNRTWDLRCVSAFINCSEPCRASTFKKFLAHPALQGLSKRSLQVCYAMAENVFAVSQTYLGKSPKVLTLDPSAINLGDRVVPRKDGSVSVMSCGHLIVGVDAAILDPTGRRCTTDGLVGEILISGKSLYSGYYQRPTVTADRFRAGWHHTGDIGFLHDGELYVLGRKDDLLIVRGKNVYAHEVEDCVGRIEAVIPGRAVAFDVFNAQLETSDLIVMCELRPEVDAAAARREVRQAVEADTGIAPAQVVVVDAGKLIKTTSGKIARNDNRRVFLEMRNVRS